MTTLDYYSYELLDEPEQDGGGEFFGQPQHHQEQPQDDAYHYSLSDAQDKALSLVPVVTGLISAYGSLSIIRMVLRSKRNRDITCYKRIMIGLSCTDIISSLSLSLQAFLVPADTSQRIWAIGNDATCSVMGFFQQLSTSIIWYNGMLSFYYLLTIRFGVSEREMVSVYEPMMHSLAIGFPLLTASIMAGLQVYGEYLIGHWCWIQGDHALLLTYATAGIPIFLFLLVIIPINNLVVYCHVRKTIRNNENGFSSSSASATLSSSSLPFSASGGVTIANLNDSSRRHVGGTVSPATPPAVAVDPYKSFGSISSGITTLTTEIQLRVQDHHTNQQPQHLPSHDHPVEDPDDYESAQSAIVSLGTSMSRSTASSSNGTAFSNEQIREIQREVQDQKQRKQRQNERLQQVALQAFLYVAGVMVCNLPTLILRVLGGAGQITPSDEAKYFPLLLFQAILLPLQGLFNYIIFARFSTSYVREME